MAMNIVLWIVAGLLAVVFLAAGSMKLFQPKDKLESSQGWVADFRPWAVKAIGVVEVLGALGLILPAVTRIVPILVPIAAAGLALLMVGAMITHLRRGEKQMVIVNVVLAALAVFVALGRSGAWAF